MAENVQVLYIEYLRSKMCLLAGYYGVSAPQVLKASQLLDVEISKYYHLYHNN